MIGHGPILARGWAMMEPMPRNEAREANTLVGLAVAAVGPIVAAAVVVPFRDDLDSANLALILVLVVVIAAILGGRRAGAVAAIMATLSFDFFLVRPYLSMQIESADDIETALILLGVGLLVGQVASRGRRARRGQEQAVEAIDRLHRVADLAARGAPVEEVVATVTGELQALLSLSDCWLEWRPFVYVMPRLERGGAISQAEHRWLSGGVMISEDGVELPVVDHGTEIARLVLVGNPSVAVTLEQRVVAVALGDQLGLALALAGPAEQQRLAQEFRKE
jgi:hypothetical protein